MYSKEFHIFGTNRVGYLMDKMFLGRKTYGKTIGGAISLPHAGVISIPNPFQLPGSTTLTPVYFGNKKYELSDWLGNVRVVITDKKYAVNNGNTTISYMPIIASITDYYSFGSEIKERSYATNTSYRFGFNNVEKINELYGEGNYYDFKFRGYDARIGRFWSVDPLAQKYPWNSVYAFAENRVIDGVDLEGKEWKPVKDENQKIVDYEWMGKEAFNEKGEIKEGYYKAAAIFWGSKQEKLGEGNNLFGKGSKIAKVVVYGPKGDVKEYGAYTMSSDPSKYGVVEGGTYMVYYDVIGKSGKLKSNWAVEKRGKVPAMGGKNPAYPERQPGYLTGVFIHSANKSGYAGPPVSQGCLLIVPSTKINIGWDEFNIQLKDVSSFPITIHRDYVPK